LFINVSAAMYPRPNPLCNTCYAGRIGLGEVQLGQTAEPSQFESQVFGEGVYRLKWPLALLVAIYALAVVGMAVFQRRLLYFPDRLLPIRLRPV